MSHHDFLEGSFHALFLKVYIIYTDADQASFKLKKKSSLNKDILMVCCNDE
jgi:hypothetical protein